MQRAAQRTTRSGQSHGVGARAGDSQRPVTLGWVVLVLVHEPVAGRGERGGTEFGLEFGDTRRLVVALPTTRTRRGDCYRPGRRFRRRPSCPRSVPHGIVP